MAAKRKQRGDGSTYQDKKGQWWAKVPLGDGRTRRARASSGKEAESIRKEFVAARDAGIDLRASQMTLHTWLERWLEAVAPTVKESTLEFYARHAGYWSAEIGTITLERIEPHALRSAMANMAADGLAPQSVVHARRVLGQALKMAVLDGALGHNPVERVAPPRVEPYESYALNDTEQRALLSVVRSHRLAIALDLFLALGLRRGELLGVRWADVDYERRTLTIKQTYRDGTKGSPKSKAGRRVLPLTDTLIDKLKAHWTNQSEERALKGVEWKEHGLICASEHGTPIGNLNRTFKAWLRNAGLPEHIRLHDLRHTALSDLAGDADTKTLQEIAGHADAGLTMKTYVHGRDERRREAMERTEERKKKKKG